MEKVFADRMDEFTSVLAYHYALAEDWERSAGVFVQGG